MTKIKCDYMLNPSNVRKKLAEPIYCEYRKDDGSCSLDEIEIGEEDSGWVATCDSMYVKNPWDE